jgi:crossover junction endodeoxyribonuclease RuvC
MRVLGVDPGLRLTGYAVVECSFRGGARAEPTLVEAGVVRLKDKTPVAARLVELERDLVDVIDRLAPDHCCVEKLFAHYKRPVTAAIMGHARGVVLLAAQRAGVAITELNATEVKKSVTGTGHASKRQVAESVAAQLRLAEPPSPPDVADAIAIALTAARRIDAPVVAR